MTQISNDIHEAGLPGVLPHFIHIFTFAGAIKWILEIVQTLGQFFEPLYVPYDQSKADSDWIWSNLMSVDWAWAQAVCSHALHPEHD